ncbi:Exocyst complex protein EXO70 [Candida viswanathii]|uniref:Exocyst complex protein EXO70 n=1 Tax=Candida viswanathii TaxID=5486 RepID=A0A367YJG5_9ASCO|nr:Exocyst complex protein EXO70 [Candida viswanathii]
MLYEVDVDEADIDVLDKNLRQSKELFESIDKSLYNISNKSRKASTTIKPVLTQVNKLTKSKDDVEKGLALLKDVSASAEKINNFENTLNSPVDSIGIVRYMNTLNQSKTMFNNVKPKFKQFKGILYNFEQLNDRSERKIHEYFQALIRQDGNKLVEKKEEIKMIFKYFQEQGNDEYVNRLYVRARGAKLLQVLKPYEQSTQAIARESNRPYEKGSNGITQYTDLMITEIGQEVALLRTCNLPIGFITKIIEEQIYKYNEIIMRYNQTFSSPNVIIDNIILILEILDNLNKFKYHLHKNGINNPEFNKTMGIFVQQNSVIFEEFILAISKRFNNLPKFTENSTQEVIVEIMSKLRKISEYKTGLIELIRNHQLGDWVKAAPFAKVFSSVIINPNVDTSTPDFLLSSYYSDVIDDIMVSIELGLKTDQTMKKSTQGFILVKNLFMLESIVNRSQDLFNSLGPMGMERIGKLKNRFLKLFLEDWNHASFIIIRDMTNIVSQLAIAGSSNTTSGTGGGPVSNLSNKEREQVKELFKNFNESFEQALATYSRYNFGDVGLKQYLGNEVKKLVMNAYFKLYDKYGTSDFTKNRAKYVKYDKVEFEKLLNDRL